MRIDPENLRQHYASLSDEELLSMKRDELIEAAQNVYDREIHQRRLNKSPFMDEVGQETSAAFEATSNPAEDGAEPHWLEDGVSACSFTAHRGSPAAERASKATMALQQAGIPSRLTVTQDEDAQDVLNVVVPSQLVLHATSILDRDLFNEEHELEWRNHLKELPDNFLRALDPKIFCAGMLDRAERMKKAYVDEMARRKLKA